MSKGKNPMWEAYQKEIADDHYYFARSCIRQNFFPAAEDLYLKILRDELGKDIYDDARQTTCTGIAYHSGIIPMETTMTVVARQFALMNEAGYENFVCSCVTSFGIYAEVLETWKHFPEKEKETREALKRATGMSFEIQKNLVHASDIIYKFRQYLLKSNRGYSVSNSKKKFDSMEPYHPDLILANCPGCTFFLDRWQYVISEMEGKTYGENGYGIPVLTYEELAGLLLGYNPWDMGLQVHQVAVEPLLDKLGIEYNPNEKYKGVNGLDLGKPEMSNTLKCY